MRIAIIGGGAGGALSALHILRTCVTPAKVFLIEQYESQAGKGVAYASTLAQQPLNVVTTGMSVFSADKNDFLNWLHNSADAIKFRHATESDFMPRDLYGKYLRTRLQEAQNNSIGEMQIVHKKAVQILQDKISDQYEIILGDGSKIEADKIILATGNEPTGFPARYDKELELNKKLIINPWYKESLDDIDNNDIVFIAGSGLTMVDMVMNLKMRGHKGKIIISSRHGLIPRPHDLNGSWIIDRGSLPSEFTASSILQFLRKETKKAAEQNIGWQAVMDAFRSHTQFVFKQIPLHEKQRFLRHVRHYWDAHRHRIPADAYASITREIKNGNVEIMKGRIQSLEVSGDLVKINLKRKNKTEVIIVSKVLNCTGPLNDVSKSPSLLFQNLIASGMIASDPVNMGIKCTDEGYVVDAKNKINPDIIVIGGLRRGTLWETVAVSEIREQAEDAAAFISLDCHSDLEKKSHI